MKTVGLAPKVLAAIVAQLVAIGGALPLNEFTPWQVVGVVLTAIAGAIAGPGAVVPPGHGELDAPKDRAR